MQDRGIEGSFTHEEETTRNVILYMLLKGRLGRRFSMNIKTIENPGQRTIVLISLVGKAKEYNRHTTGICLSAFEFTKLLHPSDLIWSALTMIYAGRTLLAQQTWVTCRCWD